MCCQRKNHLPDLSLSPLEICQQNANMCLVFFLHHWNVGRYVYTFMLQPRILYHENYTLCARHEDHPLRVCIEPTSVFTTFNLIADLD
jgi:hypothetical protein